MRVDCTIHEPWLEERRLHGGHYFRVQDPIYANHNHKHSVHYKKLNMKILKNNTNNKMLVTGIGRDDEFVQGK